MKLENAKSEKLHGVSHSRAGQIGPNGFHQDQISSTSSGGFEFSKGKTQVQEFKVSGQEESEIPKSSEGAMNPPKEKENNDKEKAKFSYCHKGWHLEISCMKKTIDTMAYLPEKNNIPVPNSARKRDGNSSSNERKEKCHALVAGTSNSSSFIIDLVLPGIWYPRDISSPP